jgi:hypothetical protein
VGNELIRPIDPETAHAIEEVAKLGSKVVDASAGMGAYLGYIMGGIPVNLVGLIGDRLYHKRIRRFAELNAETREYLSRWGAKEPFEDVSPSIEIPLVVAAIDEDRDGLKELWSKLLASAMHPDRKGRVRQSFITILKQLDPIDALVFQAIGSGLGASNYQDQLAKRFETSTDEISVSVERLAELSLIIIAGSFPVPKPLGTLLLRTISD